MKIFFIIVALAISGCIQAQGYRDVIPTWSIDVDLGSSFLVARPDNVDQQFSGYTKIGFSYRYALGKRWHSINTGLAIESDRHLTDGYFVINGGKYTMSCEP